MKIMSKSRLRRIEARLAERLPISLDDCGALFGHISALENNLADFRTNCEQLSDCFDMVREECNKITEELTTSRAECERLTREIEGVLGIIPAKNLIRSCEGGGLEDIAGSLALSVSSLLTSESELAAKCERLQRIIDHGHNSCVIDQFSSRVCRCGTHGCINTHDEEER